MCRTGARRRCPPGPLSEAIVRQLGRVPYGEALALQRSLHAARVEGRVPDVLLLLEHPHVYTIGRKGTAQEVLQPDVIAARGAEIVETDRGGRITYHGPGQIVGYPIIDLAPLGGDVVSYVRRLEQALIRVAARFGVRAAAVPGLSGVWVGQEKLAAIGVRVAQSVTMHGFALNVDPDLEYFQLIVPCGIADRGVTSLQEILGEAPEQERVAAAVEEELAREFGWRLRAALPGEVGA